MRLTFTHLISLLLLAFVSASSVLAHPMPADVPGIGRHRNPSTVSREGADAAADLPARAAIVADPEAMKRTNMDSATEKRLEERVEGVLGALNEARERNMQKKKKRTRMARFHP